MKSQLKSADRSGARWRSSSGPDELAAGTVSLRPAAGDRGRPAQRCAEPTWSAAVAGQAVGR